MSSHTGTKRLLGLGDFVLDAPGFQQWPRPYPHHAPVALLTSVGLVMLGYRLQSSVLGVCAVIEEFSVFEL